MKQLFCVILMTLSLFSCHQENKESIATVYNLDKDLKLEIDSFVIQLDSVSLPEYLSKTAVLEIKDSLWVYAHNHKTSHLDVFYLGDGENQIEHIALSKEGKDAVLDVMALQVLSKDSIFICDGMNYLLINSKGNVFWKKKALFQKRKKVYMLESAFFTKLFYDNRNNRIYGRYMSTGEGYPFPEKELFAYYDLAKDSLVTLPIELPSYVEMNKTTLGRNATLHAFFYVDRICYNFSGMSDLFVYDINKDYIQQKGGKSLLFKEKLTAYEGDLNDSSKKWKHYLENTNYNPLLFNPYTQLYYRISFGNFVGEEDFGDLGHYKKEIILTVFNKELEVLQEYKLPNYQFNFLDYFPVKEGILTFGNNPLNESISYEKIVFYKIKVK